MLQKFQNFSVSAFYLYVKKKLCNTVNFIKVYY